MSGHARSCAAEIRQGAREALKLRIGSEARAMLAADAVVAMMALRPATSDASVHREKAPARTLRLQELEPANCRMRRDKRRSRFGVAVAKGRGLPNCRPCRRLRMGQNRNDPPAQNPKARLAVQSNRLQPAPQIFGPAMPWRDILMPRAAIGPDASLQCFSAMKVR